MLRSFHRRWKRQAMVCLIANSMAAMLWSQGQNTSLLTNKERISKEAAVYEAKLTNSSTRSSLTQFARIIPMIEKEQGWELKPGNFPKLAINLDLDLAPGIAISKDLLGGLLGFLELRGYTKNDLFLVSYSLKKVKLSQYEEDFLGYEIITAKSGHYFNQQWYHESSLPPASADHIRLILKYPNQEEVRRLEGRKSYLPHCLFGEDIWWINLAKASDDEVLGIRGAVVSSTLNAAGNSERFTNDSVIGPANAVEILAIPELWEKHLFSVMDLSRSQFAGGTQFNPKFLKKSDRFWVSSNPFFLDYHAMGYLSEERSKYELIHRDRDKANLFLFAKEIGLGDASQSRIVKN
jgi:hypothetical protein